jgi:ubiquinone/menaquinone biosynthesis C-methylase UbiE
VFDKSAIWYDAIYSTGKDYARAATDIRELINKHSRRPAKAILDAACGTGKHTEQLMESYDELQGIDINSEFVDIASKRCPDGSFQVVDMTQFDLGQTFDVVTCLFGSIGYVRTAELLR